MSHLAKTDLLEICKRIRYDTTAIQVRVTELMDAISDLPIPDPEKTRCPHCGPIPGGPRTLAQHMHVSHDWPLLDDDAPATDEPDEPEAEAAA